MGMFDTFYGKYTCQHCGKIVEFKEQTKDFDNCLLDFKLGDYVDRGDKNYFYNFTYECPECHAETELSIGIRNGQYVGVFLAEDARNMDPKELENIENGLQRRLEYDKMCEEKLGLEEAGGFHDELIALKVGDTLEVLRTTWKILEAYYVKYPEGETSFLHHPTVIYRVEADGVNRVIKASINPFTYKLYYHVCKDNLEHLSPEERYKDCDINRCRIEHDSILEKILKGGSVWNAEEGQKEDAYQMLMFRGILADDTDGVDDADDNSSASLKKRFKRLKRIASTTTDKNLKEQIMQRIDNDVKALRKFEQVGDGFVFQLLVNKDGELEGYGFFRDAKYASKKGKETGKVFRIEKHQILYEGRKVIKNQSTRSPFNEFYMPGSPIAAIDFDSYGRAVDFFSDELSFKQCNSFSDNCRVILGHDYGAAVWIQPVIIEDGEKIMSSNVHGVGMEISVDNSFFNDVLLDGFMKFFNPELDVNKKRFTRAFSDEGRFLTNFEREILEPNFFTYESIKEIIKYFEDIASSNDVGKLETAEMIKVIELLKTMIEFFPEVKYISVMS